MTSSNRVFQAIQDSFSICPLGSLAQDKKKNCIFFSCDVVVCVYVCVLCCAAWSSSCGDICWFNIITAYPLLSATTRDKTRANLCTHTYTLVSLSVTVCCSKKCIVQSSYSVSVTLGLSHPTVKGASLQGCVFYKNRLLWLCCGDRLCHSLMITHTAESGT